MKLKIKGWGGLIAILQVVGIVAGGLRNRHEVRRNPTAQALHMPPSSSFVFSSRRLDPPRLLFEYDDDPYDPYPSELPLLLPYPPYNDDDPPVPP